jgi:hypothetical protein
MSNKYLPPIHIACSDDELRPSMMHVEVLDGIATATNGMLIVRLNLSEHSSLDDVTIKKLSGRYIHRDIWNLLHSADLIFFKEDEDNVITYSKGGVSAEIMLKTELEIKFPDYGGIVNRIANTKFDKKSFIAFDPEWISIAKKIFSTSALIMRFYEQEQMFTIFPGGDAKAFMGIMPMMITEEDAVFDFSLT